MQRVTGLPEEQVLAYEAQAELAMRAALQGVMDKIAQRVEASMPVLASVLVAADGEPPPEPPPGQPYVSPDDLASIPPLWQQAVEAQILPVVAQVFMDAAGRLHTSMVEASSIAGLPSVGSLAAEQYLAQARNTFAEVGDDLWGIARAQLLEGFEQGESIPELAERLRQSANMTARRGVLVARTQVNEASNAGSFAVAQASGLQMKKEWIATPDLRTRPTHLAADGQRVDLNEPFIVGGFSAMFPAAPSLPPAERYNCRCTVGYVMPDRAPAQVKADDLQTQELADLPGTTPTTLEKAAEPGPEIDLPAYGHNPPSYVRPSLQAAKTPRELRRVWQDEVQAVTGFPFYVDAMPRGISMVTAREYAEGTLQMFEQFPAARLDRIHWFDDAAGPYAHVRSGAHAIEFNMRYATETARPKLLASRRKDVAGWDGPQGLGWSVRGDVPAQGIVYHEFIHIVDEENLRRAIHGDIIPLLIRHAQREGVTDIDDLIKRRISSYATENYHEMIAEAATDVMVNGAAASALSRDIFDLLRAEYRRRGFAIRTAPIDELAAEAERYAKQVAPSEIRPTLEAARTTGAVERVFRDEFERITGRRPRSVSFAGSAATAREHAEGLLRGLDRFPDAKLDRVSISTIREGTHYAQTSGDRIDFSYEWSQPASRRKYLDSLAGDVAGWDLGVREWGVGIFRASAFHPRGTGNPIAVALHEFGHVLDIQTTAKAIRPDLERLLKRRTAAAQRVGRPAPETPIIDQEDLIFREISGYATKNYEELVAEAFSDVMINGNAASTLSRDIFDILEAEYRRTGGVVRAVMPGEALPSMPLSKAAAPRALSTQTVAQLRALAKERGIAIPAGARKADLVKALEESPKIAPPLDEKAALRAAARERNRLIESSQGTAKLLAELDELIANKATKAAIRQRLDPALIAPEQVYAGADPAVVEALRKALDTGDPAKLRSALTRAGTKTKLKPIGKAGAKAKFDPETMEGVGGIDIAADAQVTVVRRGTTLTLPDGSTLQLTRAQVTPIAPKPAQVKAPRTARAAAGARPAGVKARSTASYARLRGEARAVARQADIDAATGYGDAALRLDELVANGATERAITHAVDGLARQFGIKVADVERLRALVGQPEALRATIHEIAGREGVEIVGATNDVVRFDRAFHESIGAEIANGTPVQLVVPGSRIHLGREVITQHRARVQTTTRPLIQAEPPAPAAAIGRPTPGAPYATRQAEVEQLAKRKPTDTRQLGGGATARTELEEFAGDQRAVRKTYGVRSPHQRKSDIGREADAEELAPEVVDAFGVRSAAVTRTGKDQILMEFIDGKTVAEEFPGYGYGTADQTLKISRPFTESDDGRLLGLADYIMGMGDRNEGNWIYRIRNGRVEITAIDHGFAFLDQRGLRPQSNFFSDFLQDEHNLDLLRSTIDVNPADLRVIRDRLEHLRQRFAEAGRKSWHDGMMRRLKALEQRADPNAPIRLAVT